MKDVLLEYGTSEVQWGLLLLFSLVLLGGIILVRVIRKETLNLKKNTLDTIKYVGWGFIAFGSFCIIFTLFNSNLNEAKNNRTIHHWKDENDYYVENYGKIDGRSSDRTFTIEKGSNIVEKKADTIIEGCDYAVFAELTNGDVWLCVQEK
ncbi:hypothetical protein [Halobacillus litoralis]|uniref:hypothetical protein n=1 Tax=Halobacillus litoralis TaxID=45668 RepID=UPI001CFDE946|nr:hypothetical protein [Halobacillus litoralis]